MMMMMVMICLLWVRSAGNEVLMRGPLAGDGRRWRYWILVGLVGFMACMREGLGRLVPRGRGLVEAVLTTRFAHLALPGAAPSAPQVETGRRSPG